MFDGRVTVGGEVVRDPARDVGEGDAVAVDGKPAALERRHVVYALHKPAGYVSTAKDPQGRPTVVSLIPSRERLYPVGRLDADTTGLLLLTNDGELAHRLTHPSFEVPRVYRAQVRSPPVREPALRKLREGVLLDDGRTAPARVRRLAPDRLEIVLHEGRKRQVRRMCEAVGHRVVRLERVAFGPLRLGDLPLGGHRRLSAAEVEQLRKVPGRAPKRRAERGGRRDGFACQASRSFLALAFGDAWLARSRRYDRADAPDRLQGSEHRRRQRARRDPRRDRGADARADRAQRAGDRRPRELHLHAHARPRRRVPGGRRAPHGPQPRAADVRAGDRRARARCRA